MFARRQVASDLTIWFCVGCFAACVSARRLDAEFVLADDKPEFRIVAEEGGVSISDGQAIVLRYRCETKSLNEKYARANYAHPLYDLATEGARAVVVADVDESLARSVAAEIGGLAVKTDVASEPDIVRLVERTTTECGPIDLFCSNAGICLQGGADAPDADWDRLWQVNVMAHVYAARAVLPSMIARGTGYLLQTASAAGLLTQIGSAPYSVTKHAAVGFAEWLSITHAKDGIRVSCLCPQGVRTAMLNDAAGGLADHLRETALEPEAVAAAVIDGLAAERFLILPHPEVAEFFRHKAEDYERWLRGMRRLQDRLGANP